MKKSQLRNIIRESIKELAGLNQLHEIEDCKCLAGEDSPCCGKGCCCKGTMTSTNQESGETKSWTVAFCCSDPTSGHHCEQHAKLSPQGPKAPERKENYSEFGGLQNMLTLMESIKNNTYPLKEEYPNQFGSKDMQNEDTLCCLLWGCCDFRVELTDEQGNKTVSEGARCCGLGALTGGACCPGGVSRDDILGPASLAPMEPGGPVSEPTVRRE